MILDPKPFESKEQYVCRVSAPLFETLQIKRNICVITISPKDTVLQKYSPYQLDSLVKDFMKGISHNIHYILYPEVSSNLRYHYHGIIYTDTIISERPEDIHLYYEEIDELFRYVPYVLERKVGRTLIQRIESLTESYTSFNVNSKRCESTSFEQILKYITKQINSKELINFYKMNDKLHSLLKKKKTDVNYETTYVLTDLNNEILFNPLNGIINIDNFISEKKNL